MAQQAARDAKAFSQGRNVFLLEAASARETVSAWGAAAGFPNAAAYAFLGLAGGNFLFEVAFNLVLSPIIVRLLAIKRKKA